MITDRIQSKAYAAVAAALPFPIDPSKITVEAEVSYLPSPVKLHDYAAGVMAAFGSVVVEQRVSEVSTRQNPPCCWRSARAATVPVASR